MAEEPYVLFMFEYNIVSALKQHEEKKMLPFHSGMTCSRSSNGDEQTALRCCLVVVFGNFALSSNCSAVRQQQSELLFTLTQFGPCLYFSV